MSQIKLNGQRIEASEIEAVIQQTSGVRDVVAVIQKTAAGVDQLVAYVLPQTVEPDVVAAACRSLLPQYMVPSLVLALQEWPLSSSGKLDRAALHQPVADKPCTPLSTNSTWPPLEEQIRQSCNRVLQLPPYQLGRDTCLLAVGLASLQAVILHQELQRQGLLVASSAVCLMQNPSVAELAAIAQNKNSALPLEENIASFVQDVLCRDDITIESSFRECMVGADFAFQVCLMIAKQLKIFVTPDDLMQLDTPLAVAEHVGGVTHLFMIVCYAISLLFRNATDTIV